MRTAPGRRGIGRVAVIFLTTVLMLASCGGDDAAGPGNGNGNGETIVLSASSSAGWTCDVFVSSHSGPTCSQITYRSNEIADFWIPGGFRIVAHSTLGTSCCNRQMRDGPITSATMDLSGYATLRLKGHLKLYFERDIGLARCSMAVWLLSNVPNTPDLELVSEELNPYEGGELLLEREVDVSLENGIGYTEATLFIRSHVDGGCGGGLPTDVYAELSGFQIVGTK